MSTIISLLLSSEVVQQRIEDYTEHDAVCCLCHSALVEANQGQVGPTIRPGACHIDMRSNASNQLAHSLGGPFLSIGEWYDYIFHDPWTDLSSSWVKDQQHKVQKLSLLPKVGVLATIIRYGLLATLLRYVFRLQLNDVLAGNQQQGHNTVALGDEVSSARLSVVMLLHTCSQDQAAYSIVFNGNVSSFCRRRMERSDTWNRF